ncbi:MAG: helix-turn-helix domain-containing protein [Caulobacterales bacterium]
MDELGWKTGQRRADDAAARLPVGLFSFAWGISVEEISAATRRSAEAAFARQGVMYLCRVGVGLSLSRVAHAFGRDRSTIAHACRIIEDRSDMPQFDAWIGALEDSARAAPPPTKPSFGWRDGVMA